MHIFKAVLFSSLTVVPAYLITVILSGDIGNDLLWLVMMTAFVLGLIGVIFVGIPTYIILNGFKVKSTIPYLCIGFIVPTALVWSVHPFGEDGFYGIVWQGLLMGSFGALCAYVFWRNAVQGNKMAKVYGKYQ